MQHQHEPSNISMKYTLQVPNYSEVAYHVLKPVSCIEVNRKACDHANNLKQKYKNTKTSTYNSDNSTTIIENILKILFHFQIMINIYYRVNSWTNQVGLHVAQVRIIYLTNLIFSSFGSWIKFNKIIVESNFELYSSWFSSLPILIICHLIVQVPAHNKFFRANLFSIIFILKSIPNILSSTVDNVQIVQMIRETVQNEIFP